jgi:phosphate acyltransferase
MSSTIGIDLMGADVSPDIIYDAVQTTASKFPQSRFVLFSHPSFVVQESSQIQVSYAAHVIEMEDSPLQAVRCKKDSSLVSGILLLQEQKIDAFISCGNTGALVAASSLYLSHLPNIDRPALLALFPSRKGSMVVLDVGGNVSVKAKQLCQFAKMGTAYFKARFSGKIPKVALLNIGSESEKGTKELQEAYHILQAAADPSFIFAGNVEPSSVFMQDIDVLVTSGFAGNIFLKTAEGVASFVFQKAAERLSDKQELTHLAHELSYEAYAGALVAGVDGVVVKCHGYSSKEALCSAIEATTEQVQAKFLNNLKQFL